MWQLGIVQLSDLFLLLYLRRDRVWNLTWDQKWSPLSAAEEPEDPPWWWRGRSWERGCEEEEVSRMKQLTRAHLIPVRLKSWENVDVSYRAALMASGRGQRSVWGHLEQNLHTWSSGASSCHDTLRRLKPRQCRAKGGFPCRERTLGCPNPGQIASVIPDV